LPSPVGHGNLPLKQYTYNLRGTAKILVVAP
jgi:hypothetical protein